MAAAVVVTVIGTTGHAAGQAPWIAYAASALVALVFVCGPLYLWWGLGRWEQDGGEPSEGEGEGGGRGPRGGHTPPQGSPETDPEWWPEFERQFAAHAGFAPSRSQRARSAPTGSLRGAFPELTSELSFATPGRSVAGADDGR
jgi:hypothetical protein